MNISGIIGASLGGKVIRSSTDFAELLLESANVAVVPGAGFGSDSHVRLSYATSLENIDRGLSRIEQFVAASGYAGGGLTSPLVIDMRGGAENAGIQ